ncbi:MAG: outer membrane protein assembly factor BamD [Chitinivibrionales bacterium]|nr:outer membrane protein assembly factor BamD [Chitinivibrionales bacterium]
MKAKIVVVGVAALLFPGCSHITMLRVEELKEVQAHVDTLAMRLDQTQRQLLKEQKRQSELLRVVRADMQVRFGEISQRVSAVEGGVYESQERLTDIDRKTAEIRERWDEKARADSMIQAMEKAEEENLYQIANSDFTSGRFGLAMAGFRDFLVRYPESEWADPATYWVAECHYAQKNLDSAKTAYTEYLKQFPEGQKVCGALYKLGLVFDRTERAKHRDTVWDKLLSQCPESEEARMVQGRRKQ